MDSLDCVPRNEVKRDKKRKRGNENERSLKSGGCFTSIALISLLKSICFKLEWTCKNKVC